MRFEPEIILDPSYAQILTVARNMRAWDAAEIWPMHFTKRPEDLAARCMHSGIRGVVWCGRPIVAFGFFNAGPKYYQAWMFATDEWPRVALTLTRFARREMLPFLFDEQGANRIEARSLEGHVVAQDWMRALGAEDEGEIIDRGENRETYRLFALTRSKWEYVHLLKPSASGAAITAGANA